MPKVVSTVLLPDAKCCRYLVAISPDSKVLTSDTGSSSNASIDGYCLNGRVFNDTEIEAGSAFRALDVSAEFSFIVDNSAFCSFDIVNSSSSSFFSSVGCADDEALTRLFHTSFLFDFWSLYQ